MSNGQLHTPLHLGFSKALKLNEPNGVTFRVVGRLMKLDRVRQLLQVRVYPVKAGVKPFEVRICATPRLLRTIDSGWTGVEVRGGVIGNQLIADEVRPVYAPVKPSQMPLLAKERLQARRQIGQWRRHALKLARQEERRLLREYLLGLIEEAGEQLQAGEILQPKSNVPAKRSRRRVQVAEKT